MVSLVLSDYMNEKFYKQILSYDDIVEQVRGMAEMATRGRIPYVPNV